MFIFKFFGFFLFAILALFGFFFILSAVVILRTILFSGFKKKFFQSKSFGTHFKTHQNARTQSSGTIEAEYRILNETEK
jgi:hypothetical protein